MNNDNMYAGPAQGSQNYQGAQGPVPPRHEKIDHFFAWIRSSGLMRGNNRWIAGVCDGIAVRYGLSPVFVRAIVAASTLVFGFGAAFYAAGWVLLPDCRDGRISGEELAYGHWQWSLLGPIIFMIIAFVSPGVGVLLAVIAVGVLLIMVNSLQHQSQGRNGDGGAMGWGTSYQSPAGPYGPNPPQQGNWQSAKSDANASGADDPRFEGNGPRPESFYSQPDGGWQSQSFRAFGASTDPQGSDTSQPVDDGTTPSSWSVNGAAGGYGEPPTYMAEPYGSAYQQARPYPQPVAAVRAVKRIRRKPAGFILVLFMLGAIILSGAIVAIVCVSEGGYLGSIFKMGTIWIAGVLLGLGVVIALLGMSGRRAGGLHPLVWIAAMVAITLISSDIGYSYVLSGMNHANTSYRIMNVSGFKALDGSDKTQFSQLSEGVAFKGNRVDNDVVNIDMSEYQTANGTHEVELNDGTKVQSGCPTGRIDLTVQQSTVYVTLPAGCSYRLSHGTNTDIHAEIQKRHADSKTSKPSTPAEPAKPDKPENSNSSQSSWHMGSGTQDATAESASAIDGATEHDVVPESIDQRGVSNRLGSIQPVSCTRRHAKSGDGSEYDESFDCGSDEDDDDDNADDEGNDYYDSQDDNSQGDRFCFGFCDGSFAMGSWLGDDLATGTKSLGSGYVAIGRGSQIGIGGDSYDRLEFQHGIRSSKDYEWFFSNNRTKMPKGGPELTIDAPYVVEGRVTVQYPKESTVPTYERFSKEQVK